MDGEIVTPDVLVVGCGPIGGPLAIGLKNKGYNVLLVEKQAKAQRVFKGEYIQPAATQVLKRLGLSRIFAQPSYESVRELRFRDLAADGSVISEILMQYPSGFHASAISHHELLSSIREHVVEELGEDAHFGALLTPLNAEERSFTTQPRFTIKKADGTVLTVAPKWVVGCDGRNSSVRKWMGGKKLPQNLPVALGAKSELIVGAEISTAPPIRHRYEVFRFHTKGTLSSFSLGTLGQRLYLSHPDTGATGLKGSREKLRGMLRDIDPICSLGHIEDNSPIPSFPAYGLWLGPATRDAFLLAGDSSCVTSPYGGQGIAAGLEHVEYLMENFDFSRVPGHAASEMCEDYGHAVRRIYDRVTLLNFGLYYLFFARQPMFKSVSSYILNVWESNPEMKERVVRLFAGLDQDRPSVIEVLELWGLTWSPLQTSLQSLMQRYMGLRALNFLLIRR